PSFSQRKIRNHFFKQRSFEKYLYATMPEFKTILDSPTVYRTQIYFSKIKRDENGKVKFTDYHFKKHDLYYYPASCVKLPVIADAIKIEDRRSIKECRGQCILKDEEISSPLKNRILIEDTSYCGFAGQTEIQNGWELGEYVKRMLVVSNNICFNPLYEIYQRQHYKMITNHTTRIQQRFNYACDSTANAKLFPCSMISGDTFKIREKKVAIKNYPLDNNWATAGLRYLDAKDSLINHPKSFAKSNYISLENLQKLFKNIVADKIDIRKEDRNFLLKYMSIYPSECRHPAYDAKEYPDNWGKYLLIGDDTNFHKSPVHQLQSLSIGEGKGEVAKEKLMQWADDSIRIFNKVGMAYGFLTDCAYIVDYKNQVEFIVSASVFVDRDGTLNDGKYAYKEIGLPFLGKLGRVLLQHELKHKRKSKFAAPKMEYND
ncbi:MAG: hypothetical protein RI955_1283, partial [Bacteroidota bacterium]